MKNTRKTGTPGNSFATVQKVIGDTTYIVEYAVSENARETVYEKVKRMILNDAATIPLVSNSCCAAS